MSKAILVIDIPKEYELDQLAVNYILYSVEGKILDGDMGRELKPLPMKRDKHKGKIVVRSKKEATNMQILINQCSDIGFNACLEQILGEE